MKRRELRSWLNLLLNPKLERRLFSCALFAILNICLPSMFICFRHKVVIAGRTLDISALRLLSWISAELLVFKARRSKLGMIIIWGFAQLSNSLHRLVF
jgi:hypothetical protein